MTLNGFLQLGIYFLVLLAVTKPLRGLHDQGIFWRENVPEQGFRPGRAIDLSDMPH